MSGALGLGILVFGATLLVVFHADRPIAGLAPDEAAILGAFCAATLVLASWVVNAFRVHWTEGLRALLVWGAVSTGLLAAYARQDELAAVLDRMIGEVSPGRTVVSSSGEVVVARRADGSFTLAGRVNDRNARFIFDTGASTVVLTAESAAASGFKTDSLSYSVPVATANGAALAAPVILETLTIGPIVEHRVRALVVRPGLLRENLLGLSFLDRLASYEVRGNRLIMRAKS